MRTKQRLGSSPNKVAHVEQGGMEGRSLKAEMEVRHLRPSGFEWELVT